LAFLGFWFMTLVLGCGDILAAMGDPPHASEHDSAEGHEIGYA
jgi:hypothetical protein